jgi:hypothetical protein
VPNEPNYEAPVGGADTGNTPAAPSTPPAGATPQSPSGTGPNPPSSPAPSGASPAANGQPPDSNGNWIPRHRLNEVTDQARREIARLQQEITKLQPKPAAPAPDPEADAIKQQFFKLFPAAQKLFELQPDKLEQLLGAAPHWQAQTEHYWTNVGANYLRQLEQSMHTVYGGAPDAKARRWFESAFIDWVNNDPEAQNRYIQQDPNLVSDFWKQAEQLMLDPVRRSAIAAEQRKADRRNRLPAPAGSTQALGKGPAAKPKDEDELHERAFEAFEAASR